MFFGRKPQKMGTKDFLNNLANILNFPCRKCSKAGFSRWLSLLIIIPEINMIVIYVVDFSKWPALNKKDSK